MIVNATCSVGNISYKKCNVFDSFDHLILLNVYIHIIEFFFCFIPTTYITIVLYLSSWFFCFMNVFIWWIPFIRICWNFLSHNGRFILDILFDLNLNARPKNTPGVFWVHGKRYSTDISEKCHVSWQKDKHIPWYLKYKLLNDHCIACTKVFGKTAK